MVEKVTEYEIVWNEYEDAYTYNCKICGLVFFNHDDASDYQYCPTCGARIVDFEVLECKSCEHAEYDGDGYHCENKEGKYSGECVDDSNFDGCREYDKRNKS